MGSPAILINRYSLAEDREEEGNEDFGCFNQQRLGQRVTRHTKT